MWAGIRNCVCERYRKIIIHSVLCRFFMSTAVSSRINGTGVLLCHSSSNNNNFTGTSSKNAQPSKNYHLNALRPTNCCLILPTVFLSFSSGKPTTCFQIRFYCYLISWLFPSIHIYIYCSPPCFLFTELHVRISKFIHAFQSRVFIIHLLMWTKVGCNLFNHAEKSLLCRMDISCSVSPPHNQEVERKTEYRV